MRTGTKSKGALSVADKLKRHMTSRSKFDSGEETPKAVMERISRNLEKQIADIFEKKQRAAH